MSTDANELDEGSEAVLRLAIETVAPSFGGMSRNEAELAVTRRAMFLRRMMSPDSLPAKALKAAPIPCRIVSKRYDESCCRYYIEFCALSNQDGTVEHIRSLRNDGRAGSVVDEIWAPIEPGCEAVIYKLNEEPRESDKKAAPQGYRTAPFAELLPRAKK